MRPHLARKSIHELLADYHVKWLHRGIEKWHLTWPAKGELRGVGQVTILATDGFLALFERAPGELLDGHYDNFDGKVSVRDQNRGKFIEFKPPKNTKPAPSRRKSVLDSL
jgi:hypothetical protein